MSIIEKNKKIIKNIELRYFGSYLDDDIIRDLLLKYEYTNKKYLINSIFIYSDTNNISINYKSNNSCYNILNKDITIDKKYEKIVRNKKIKNINKNI